MENSYLATRVKENRTRSGMSQEALADKTGLSHRTIQRIENGESNPTGDTLQRLSTALGVNPDDLMDWTIKEDNGYLIFMNIAALSFVIFPILGILIPFIMWTSKKDQIKDVHKIGVRLINFEITWFVFLFLIPLLLFLSVKTGLLQNLNLSTIIIVTVAMYLLNIVAITMNTFRIMRKKHVWYYSPIRFLR